MLMEFPNLAPLSFSLRGIFWLYASKDDSSASLADLLDLAVLLIYKIYSWAFINDIAIGFQNHKVVNV